jgi:chromosome segregation protein
MHLKELTLLGFKSFAEKTTLRFQPGVTCIVGPNGCGKSNVSDSVRWVLGEQSAKALRGGEMADIIFSGTDSRKALGMAEVSLTITDITEKITPVPGVNFDFNEVTVTRRVFRDGQSQYFINKVPCRLKDIQQVFWDTGIGRGAYSMMEQGKIDLVISSKPEDRRAIFEEAAGITKFKAQKKEALRKLEYVEANLVRVTDIIREVKRQIGSLQRQAGKARRYKELHEQLKRLDCQLARHKYDLLKEDIQKLTDSAAELESQAQKTSIAVENEENALAQLRRDLDALDRKISQTQQREFETKTQAERAQTRIETNTARIAEYETLTQRHTQDIADAERKIVEQEKLLAEVNAQLESFNATLTAAEDFLKEQQDALKIATENLRAAESAHRDQQTAAIELQRRISGLHNELATLESQTKKESLRFEQLTAERASLTDQLTRTVAKREEFQKKLAAERSQLETSRQTLQTLEQNLGNAGGREAALTEKLSSKQNQLAAQRSRLQLLEQLRAQHEAEQENLIAELRSAANSEITVDAIVSSISQVITIEPDYSNAVEAALGGHLQAILVRDADAAKTIRASLNGKNNKAIALAPLDLANAGGLNGSEPHPQGTLCWANKMVSASEEFQPLVHRLLDGVAIAVNLQTALDIHRATNGECDIATLDGEFVSRRGIVSFGIHTSGSASLPIPQAQLTELTDAIAKLTAETQAVQSELAQATAARELAERKLEQTETNLHALEVALATRDGEFAALENEWRETKDKIETVRWELQRLGEAGGEEKARRNEIQAQLVAAEQEDQQAKAKLAEALKNMDEVRAVREESSQKVTDARVALAAQQQKRDTLLAQQAPVATRVAELRDLIAARKQGIADFAVKIQQLAADIERAKQEIVESQQSAELIQIEVGTLEHSREQMTLKIDAQDAALKQKRRTQQEFQQKRNELELQLERKRMEMANLNERIVRAYQIPLENIRSENITVTIADAGQPQKTEITPTELAQAGLAPDWNAIETQVAELQAKIDGMGPVNVEAITEYDELEQRHKFLTEQHEDLVKSQQQLLQLISKINAETRKMFIETFEQVRNNFQGVFTELFGGGKANLILADENDPLECGIEIVAKPPGKQLQSISLLSGGERAMTAVALLFSIYMVKPSPFCLLDEIDAPLDESNINRFVKMLQRFTSQSQFVIISHNKRTIAMADAIYGVTMEEHGVSKIVSVKFTKKAVPQPVVVGAEVDATGGTPSTASVEIAKDCGDAVAPAADHHEPGHEPIHNDLLNEHDSKRAPVAPHHSMESYEPEDESPDDAEISTEVVEGASGENSPPPKQSSSQDDAAKSEQE